MRSRLSKLKEKPLDAAELAALAGVAVGAANVTGRWGWGLIVGCGELVIWVNLKDAP